VADLTRRLEDLRVLQAAAHASTDHLGELEDIDAFRVAADEGEQINLAVRNADIRAAAVRELDNAGAKQADLTVLIEALDDSKARAVAAAHMPIEGLAFDDEGVTYNGLPFRQCSASEQLRVSVAMCMAVNPTVRVIRITDGSLLDSDSLALIAEMAGANDFQVWCEVVDESGQLGITIEDGSVVAP
jgi:hypothetical protein